MKIPAIIPPAGTTTEVNIIKGREKNSSEKRKSRISPLEERDAEFTRPCLALISRKC